MIDKDDGCKTRLISIHSSEALKNIEPEYRGKCLLYVLINRMYLKGFVKICSLVVTKNGFF